METQLENEAELLQAAFAPHSLGNPINWKHLGIKIAVLNEKNSPLAGEPNKLETLVAGLHQLGAIGSVRHQVRSSPLAGEPNKLETPSLLGEVSYLRRTLPTRWGTQ